MKSNTMPSETPLPLAFDEMLGDVAASTGQPRLPYQELDTWLRSLPPDYLAKRHAQAEVLFRRMGITFAVYGDADASERLIPFDVIPRILTKTEWNKLERGLVQRAQALNVFLNDIYHDQEILKAGLIPQELILTNPAYTPEMQGIDIPHDIYVQIAGIDLVRTGPDQFYVLEDNARTPSGVSYMLENREVMMRLFPELFSRYRIDPVENYTTLLLQTLQSVAPHRKDNPTLVVLTPGQHNSAYFEHTFLADRMGVELVEGTDLFVQDLKVYMRTTRGPVQVDVIYRRVDDAFLDPLTFNPTSVLGVPGLMQAYLAGNVNLVNGVGTGIADDKAIYSYMPEIIRFYTGEAPLIDNVPTYRAREPEALREILEHLDELVVKRVDGSGGYGMLIGPHATKAELAAFRDHLAMHPEHYIAQPTLALSTCPTYVESGLAPRHVDLRPFVLTGSHGTRMVAGGLTRVAMREGSLVVNSSQGGGTKDTWVMDEGETT